MTAFDLAWTPIYLLVIFFTHWTLASPRRRHGGAAVLRLAQRSPRPRAIDRSRQGRGRGIELAETAQRNADSITAMGMLGAYRARWQRRTSRRSPGRCSPPTSSAAPRRCRKRCAC